MVAYDGHIDRDTRILLCATDGGTVLPMTTKHHADSVTESERLRRIKGSALVTDSFGESRCGSSSRC
jgi:protein phosphatase PTC6